MRNSMDSGFNEIKGVKGRRGIRDRSEEANFSPNRMKLNINEDRSNSEPPRSYGLYHPPTSSRLKPIQEKKNNREDAQGSSDEDGELSKSNSQLNESDLDVPDSGSASVSMTPTPTPLVASNARRINSETNLNDSKRRLSGFMGNRSKRFCASTSELSFASHLDTQKSLFSAKNNALSRQSFNSSLYGSNMSLSSSNSRLFNLNSPFYNGKTMFGGASAYPKRDINQHKILRTPVQMRPSSSLSNSSSTSAQSDNFVPQSTAAKHILEVMNQFRGPLKEARSMGNSISSIMKLPSMMHKRYGEEELNLDRSIALSNPTMPYGRPLSGARPESPLMHTSSNRSLQIPTMSQLLQLKRLQSNTERVRDIANRSESFLNQNHEYKLPAMEHETTGNSTGSSFKMKRNITKSLVRNDKGSVNDQLPALPVNLPNIQMPLKSIPRFDIQMAPSKPPATNHNSLISTPTPNVQFNFQNTPVPSHKKSEFSFSKPMTLCEAFDGSSLNRVNQKFVFSRPGLISELDERVPSEIVAKSPIKSSLSTNSTDSLFRNLVAQQKSASWECDSCLTRNESEKVKCLCCETSKPGSGKDSQAPAAPNATAPKSDDLFKKLAAQQKQSQWECDACMTKNDSGKDKCACCETPKSGSKPAPSASALAPSFSFGMPTNPPKDDLFKSIVAQQKTKQWECDACMTGNDASKDTCACCETPRAGFKPVSSSSSFSFGSKPATNPIPASSSFSYGTKKDDGFQKLVAKQSDKWECTACLTRNEQSKSKCMCCEQDKPGTDNGPAFSFGSKLTSSVSLPAVSEVKFQFGMPATAAKVDTPATTIREPAKEQKDEVDKPKPTFSFGMNKIVSAPETIKLPEVSTSVSAPAFTFKAPASSSASIAPTPAATASFTLKAPETVEAKQDEPKVAEKPPTFSFGAIPSAASKEPEKTITFGAPSKPVEPVTSIVEPAKAEEPKKSDFGAFKFGDKPANPPTFGSSLNKNGGFSFGGFGSKPAEVAEPVKPVPALAALPSAPGGFSFGSSSSNSINFGNAAATTVAPPVQSSNSFVFGASKTDNEPPKIFAGFGANNTMNSSMAIPSIQSAPVPVFGQPNAAPGGFSFTAKKEETAVAAPSIFAFGAKPAEPSSAPTPNKMLFGGSNPIQTMTPVFGAGSAPPTFGSNAPTNNNNESGFGSKMPSFGNANQSQKRSFDFPSPASDMSQAKKLDFGNHQQQQQQPQQQPQQHPSSMPFQFGAQGLSQGIENKPAFNFGNAATPSFNFSNPTPNNLQNQQNLFQFGANNSNSTQGIFAFAPSSAPVMQFGSGAATPGITAFSAQSTGSSSAAANQRRILRATRKTAYRR